MAGRSALDGIVRNFTYSYRRLKALLTLPSAPTVFLIVLGSYFLVISGFVYDIISEPPGIGSRQDPISGQWVPQVFMAGRVNGQYIIEGLSSGFMFVFGGVGIIFINLAADKTRQKNVRLNFLWTGVSMAIFAYFMSMVFLRIKVPGYLR